jgi:antitoxin VapB
MTTAKLFQNGRSQAVRLPKEFRFAGKEVRIEKMEDGVLLRPVHQNWVLFEACGKFSDDFFADGREQLPLQKRPRLRR